MEDVSMDDKTINVESVKQKCTALTVTIDVDTLKEILEAVVEEMEEDNLLYKIFEVLSRLSEMKDEVNDYIHKDRKGNKKK